MGISDTDALQIININIDFIDAEDMGNSEWYINTSTTKESNTNQETGGAAKCCATTDSISKSTKNSTKSMVNTNANKPTNYFLSGPNCDIDKKKSAEWTQQTRKEFNDLFDGIGCFEGTFSLQVKLDSRPYQVPPRCVAYVLLMPFKDELERQQQDIIEPLRVNEISEWCNSFVLVPKANSKVRLCLDPAQLNHALLRPTHKLSILNDILPKLNNIRYMSIIDASSMYHSLQLDNKSSYLTKFACQFGTYRYK